MEYFLSRIAKSLKDEFGNNLNRHCLVFPGRRAGLYLLRHLSEGLVKPVWAPGICTINDLFRSYSSLQPAGTEVLLFELYRVYSGLSRNHESFDDFYFWGDMLINDFDDVDKYLVNAGKIFANVRDLKDIDRHFGGLDEQQQEIIRRFWVNFEPDKPTREKTGFINIWSALFEIYTGFRQSLRERNLATEGMIFRDLAESDADTFINETKWDLVHFIGFNALNRCEKTMMHRLKEAGKARFYWDYDNSYIKPGNYNSAGLFMTENLKLFGNDMPPDWDYNTLISKAASSVTRTVIETSSDTAQVKLVGKLIADLPGVAPENAHHTAVVLADENLLMPVLSSLPEGDVNITMGYPLKQTHAWILVKYLLELQRTAIVSGGAVRFQSSMVAGIISHTLMEPLFSLADRLIAEEITANSNTWINEEKFHGSDALSSIFSRKSDPSGLSSWIRDILSAVGREGLQDKDTASSNITNEFIYRIVLTLNRIEPLLSYPGITFTTDTFIRLLDRMLRGQSVPFSGEPLSGIQIMGILETRALDFRNLIILSVNEGILPAISSGSSFIPFSLREAFGLPSVNHQESIYAYHFYRLLQRAENVIFTYNSNPEGLRSGEMSRFLTQMNFSRDMKPRFLNLDFEITSHPPVPETIERTAEHIAALEKLYCDTSKERMLSPSAINTWLGCRMKFYYRYVCGLREPEKITEEIDPAMFGTILHDVMKKLYTGRTGRVMNPDELEHLASDTQLIQLSVADSIKEQFRKGEKGSGTGNELIVESVLQTYARRIIRNDIKLAPFTLLSLEEKITFPVGVPCDDRIIALNTGGYADRIDIVNGVTRIVDYKTGAVATDIKSVSGLFEEDRSKDLDGWFQILLYCEAYINGRSGVPLLPSIYRIKSMTGKPIQAGLQFKQGRSVLVLDDYNTVREEFVSRLKEVLIRIFNPSEPFTMTADSRVKCGWCPYRVLCSR
jgi:CRISPR/Cas system-associated exonuclease Cas4 (RecB family)